MYKVMFKLLPNNSFNFVSESSTNYKLISDLANEEGNFPYEHSIPGDRDESFFQEIASLS